MPEEQGLGRKANAEALTLQSAPVLRPAELRKGARSSQLRPYRPICFTASRIGVGGILSTPLNGVYISRMIKIAEETAIALRANVATVVELGAAKRPKLRKMAASHAARTNKSGSATAFCSALRNSSHWVLRRAMTIDRAWALAAACRSFVGARS